MKNISLLAKTKLNLFFTVLINAQRYALAAEAVGAMRGSAGLVTAKSSPTSDFQI